MRKCPRYSIEMEEDHVLLDGGHGYQVKPGKQGRFFSKEAAKLKAALCSQCGYTELYVEDIPKRGRG